MLMFGKARIATMDRLNHAHSLRGQDSRLFAERDRGEN